MKLKKMLLWLFCVLLPIVSFAASKSEPIKAAGLGAMAEGFLEPTSVVTEMVETTCIIIGVMFLVASIIRYFEYRRNPLAMPISRVIFLIILGLACLGLPLVHTLMTVSGRV